LANGVWRLRLSAWDLAGRSSESERTVVIESVDKVPADALASDATYLLAGHEFTLGRVLPASSTVAVGPSSAGDFGNWRLPLLDTQLSSDQPLTVESGSRAAWRDGTRVWLSVPAALTGQQPAALALAFSLQATAERLGDDPAAPRVWHPTFSSSQGWQLDAHALADSIVPDSLVRQGDGLYDRVTGLPWQPDGYTLTAPNGDRYTLDAQGRIERIHFADGAQWLVSDAGIAGIGADGAPAGHLAFLRDGSGRIFGVTGVARGDSEVSSKLYHYDASGRLALVRDLGGSGTPYGYAPDGHLLADALTANLGVPAEWDDAKNAWSGELGSGVLLGFTIRDSEIRSTRHTTGEAGAVLLAVVVRGDEATLEPPEIVGGEVLGSSVHEGARTTLFRVHEAGLKLVRLTGHGTASVTVRIVGDLNRDGRVDAIDSVLWEAAASSPVADLDGDGSVDRGDRQLLFANTGFAANRAPSTMNPPTIGTHTDLRATSSLAAAADDAEGDAVFWWIVDTTHGSSRLSADGQTLLFTPATGYAGDARIVVQADDGYTAAAPIALPVTISGAELRAIHLARLPSLRVGQTAPAQATLDFADESGVALADPAYLHLIAVDLADMGYADGTRVAVTDATNQIRATGVGPALLVARRFDADESGVQAAMVTNVAPPVSETGAEGARPAITLQPDVYPGTLTLAPGTTRQLKVHLKTPDGGPDADVHTARQLVFAGVAEQTESYIDPGTQEPLIDPATGDFVIDPVTGEIVLDPSSGETVTEVIPAIPEVRNGTRYLVSDERIASISEDGLITAHQPGRVTISVVHLRNTVDDFGSVTATAISQSDVLLVVAPAQPTDDDPMTPTPAGIALSAADGGIVQADSGETVMIGAGALASDALVSIRRIDLAELARVTGTSAPAPAFLRPLSAFHLELGEQPTKVPVQLSIPLQDPSNVHEGDEVLFLRRGVAPAVAAESPGQLDAVWWIVDDGFVATDATGKLVARTASPPYSGVTGSGDLLCVRTTRNAQTGAVQVRGTGIDVSALLMDQLAISLTGNLAGGGLTAAAAATDLIGSIAGVSDLYAINMNFGGVYQLLPLQKEFADGGLTLTIAAPGSSASSSSASDTSPRITRIEALASDKLRLTVDRLQAADAGRQPQALRVWISPEALDIDATGRATAQHWDDDGQPRRDGMRLWQKLLDLQPIASGADSVTVEVDIPDQVAASLHVLSVQRMLQTLAPDDPGRTRWVANGEAGTATIEGQTGFSVVSGDRTIRILKDGVLVREIEYRDGEGNPESLGGSKSDPIAFSLDNRLLFVAGTHGEIHALDTATLQLARSFTVGSANITSLAVSGQWLYVAEGGPFDGGGNYRLVRVHIDPTDFSETGFLQVQQIDLPAEVSGTNAPYGYGGMAITQGVHSYLAVTASRQDTRALTVASGSAGGSIFVLDLDRAQQRGGRLSASAPGAFLPVTLPDRQGKAPNFLASAGIRDNTLRFVVSDALDQNAGLATVTIGLAPTGEFRGAARFTQIPMSGALTGNSRVDGPYQLNIQRAQSPAVVLYQGTEYALVADYFFDFLDPLYANDDVQSGTKQFGGKIGIIRDPFGDRPEYLGATSPIVDGNFSRLLVSADGKTLWADLRYWPTIGDSPPPSGLLQWDLGALLAAAERNSLARQASPRPLPVDRERVGGVVTQVVTPTKYELGDGRQITSGWVVGMADCRLQQPKAVEFTDPVAGEPVSDATDPKVDKQVPEFNYGDIVRVDLIQLIQREYPETLAKLGAAAVNINWSNIEIHGPATLVRDRQGYLLTAERENGLSAVAAAVRRDYNGLQTVDSDAGKRTLSSSGIVFLQPTLDVQRLRDGKTLKPGEVSIFLSDFNRSKPDDRLELKLRVVDYERAAGTIFFGDRPLDDPGYHEFRLADSVGGESARNRLLDVVRVEQRLKYLGYGPSTIP
ncbi:MAG: hypothetical protein NFV80_00090, partial [Candidatus Accumulibacter sp.]|nr:hypothetical protein [Accumulibacter sp.]